VTEEQRQILITVLRIIATTRIAVHPTHFPLKHPLRKRAVGTMELEYA
jgi:hypothetical protein